MNFRYIGSSSFASSITTRRQWGVSEHEVLDLLNTPSCAETSAAMGCWARPKYGVIYAYEARAWPVTHWNA